MKGAFVEYESSDATAQLNIIVREVRGKNLFKRLTALPECAEVERLGDGLLLVRADDAADMDDFILRTDRLALAAGSEIVESRLCPLQRGDEDSAAPISAEFMVLAPGQMTPADGRQVIYLEPGMAFGSGHHSSTRLAVQALEGIGKKASFPARVLDIGCGSGILSLICDRLGAAEVMGLDINPAALAAARHNIRLNGAGGKIVIAETPLADIHRQFDLLVANISPFVLLGMIPVLPSLLAPKGRIVLAGMRLAQAGDIRRALRDAGLAGSEKIYRSGKWVGMLLNRGQESGDRKQKRL